MLAQREAYRIGFDALNARETLPLNPADVYIEDQGAHWLVFNGHQINEFLAGTGPIVRTGAAVRIAKADGAVLDYTRSPGAAPE